MANVSTFATKMNDARLLSKDMKGKGKQAFLSGAAVVIGSLRPLCSSWAEALTPAAGGAHLQIIRISHRFKSTQVQTATILHAPKPDRRKPHKQ